MFFRFKDFFQKKPVLLFIFPCLMLITFFLIYNKPTPVYAQITASFIEETIPVQSQGERIMRALSAAYPSRIGPVEFRNGDWAFQIDGRWLYYAEGRLLPEERRNHVSEYRSTGFNSNYQIDLPSWESGAEQRETRTRNYQENLARQQSQPRPPANAEPRPPSPTRSNYFFEALYRSSTRNESWAQQELISFLGFEINIHKDLIPVLRHIENLITHESRSDAAVRQWINSLGSIGGWNWRNVASSGNRSFHSYGIAIDILPRNLGGLATYWLWTSQHDPLWWNIPYSRRWHPPNVVVKIFESNGFIWGGKWGNFDTMHFEYRPEIFILSNISGEDLYP